MNIPPRTYPTVLLSLGLMFASVHGVQAAQVCASNTPLTKPNNQYQISRDGLEVTDTQTGLIWKRCLEDTTWNGSTCAGLPVDLPWRQAMSRGTGGWRMPNIKELQSLVETACSNPAINRSIFPGALEDAGVLQDWVWSSSNQSFSNDWALFVNFGPGSSTGDLKANANSVRLVRNQQ